MRFLLLLYIFMMSNAYTNINIFNSFGYSFSKKKNYTTKGLDYWHPGFAWAITRNAYEKIGGLYDKGVLGSGDNIMALAIISKSEYCNNIEFHEDYNNSMLDFQNKASKLRLGYIPGIIRHHYHGSKINRQYTERWKILSENNFDPFTFIEYDKNGILIPTVNCPETLVSSIMAYFEERNEDEFL